MHGSGVASSVVADAPPGLRSASGPSGANRSSRLRDAAASLFPPAARRGTTRRGLLLGMVAVVVGTAISLLRTTGTGPLQSIWEEDARAILSDALNLSGGRAIMRPLAGYYVIGPRLLGELATWFPLGWAAAVLSVSAAVITACFALQVYLASGAHLENTLARLLVSAPLLFAPVAENFLSEIYNRPVCLHFFAMYALFWLLLWTPESRWGKAGLLATAAFTAFSTILIVGYLPLAVARVYLRRDRLSAWILALIAAGSALQLSSFMEGVTGRATTGPRLDPLWALGTYIFWAVPNSVLGFRATVPLSSLHSQFVQTIRDNYAIIALSWLALLAFVAAAWVGARRGWVRPQWRLAALAGGHSVWLGVMMVMANGAIAQRYLPPVELLLFSAVVVLLIPAVGVNRGRLLAALAVCIVVVSAFNYRWSDTYRAKAPVWTQQLVEARRTCQSNPAVSHVAVRGGPQPFWSIVYVPCHELLQGITCLEPRCVYLDPPQSLGRRPNTTVDSSG